VSEMAVQNGEVVFIKCSET